MTRRFFMFANSLYQKKFFIIKPPKVFPKEKVIVICPDNVLHSCDENKLKKYFSCGSNGINRLPLKSELVLQRSQLPKIILTNLGSFLNNLDPHIGEEVVGLGMVQSVSQICISLTWLNLLMLVWFLVLLWHNKKSALPRFFSSDQCYSLMTREEICLSISVWYPFSPSGNDNFQNRENFIKECFFLENPKMEFLLQIKLTFSSPFKVTTISIPPWWASLFYHKEFRHGFSSIKFSLDNIKKIHKLLCPTLK